MSTGNIGPVDYSAQAKGIMKYQHDIALDYGLKEEDITKKLASGELTAKGNGDVYYLDQENLAKVGVKNLNDYRETQQAKKFAENDSKKLTQFYKSQTINAGLKAVLATAYSVEYGAERFVDEMRNAKEKQLIDRYTRDNKEALANKEVTVDDIKMAAKSEVDKEFDEQTVKRLTDKYTDNRSDIARQQAEQAQAEFTAKKQAAEDKVNKIEQKQEDRVKKAEREAKIAENESDKKAIPQKRQLLTNLHELETEKAKLDAKLRAQDETRRYIAEAKSNQGLDLSGAEKDIFKSYYEKQQVPEKKDVTPEEINNNTIDDLNAQIAKLQKEIYEAKAQLEPEKYKPAQSAEQ